MVNTGLYDSFLSVAGSVAVAVPRPMPSIICGMLFGTLSAVVIYTFENGIKAKIDIQNFFRGVMNETKKITYYPEQSPDTRTASELAEEVRNNTNNIDDGLGLGFIPAYIFYFANAFICYRIAGAISVFSFIIFYLLYLIVAPQFVMKRYIFSQIEKIVKKTNNDSGEAKRIARRFYKTFKSWLKSGRTSEEFYRDASSILREYMDQINP